MHIRNRMITVIIGCCLLLAAGIPLQTGYAYTHTVLVEEATATWCGYCPSHVSALDEMYSSGLYDFYYVTLVTDMNTYAYNRVIGELGVGGYPTSLGDGGYQQVVGWVPNSSSMINMVNNCGNRAVADIDLNLGVTWDGNAQISIDLDVINNDPSMYLGHLHAYVTEKDSRWYVSGNQYHFAMIGDYALNEDIFVAAGGTAQYSTTWNGNTYGFGDIVPENITVIVAVFSGGNVWTDETVAMQPGLPVGDVTVTLTPYGTPIVIPANGGAFDFNIAVTNNETSPWSFAVWTDVTLPNSSIFGPIIGPLTITIPATTTINRDRSQSIPGGAPAGTYSYNAYVGNYPDDIWNSDTFTFEKSTVGDGSDFIGEWITSGDSFTTGNVASVEDITLLQNYPNPFNPETTISYIIPEATDVNLTVYDVSGRQVAELVSGYRNAGHHDVTWDASSLSAGVYIYRLSAGEFNASGKMVLLK
ncbi:hypothetical protein CEE37_10490 [candidate division LCP-89 bacterium B3_LCP]|uniref:Secretion system C-terminal sorting domain-containing protein n=1 Tax=candidate division LCP-89 bacterium B3_LCP TaxID=2012998 RepID=A0A532UXM4_UNCL8|nr:MAG: hypothetical protein CEE37_10490 [candidate division LCP-89 bacterium B3_LCP]